MPHLLIHILEEAKDWHCPFFKIMYEPTYAISPYRIMWVFVFFDLPTETKKQRKAYADFRKKLIKEGFAMHQFSVYIRHCASIEHMEAVMKRVERILPEFGKISLMSVTDKQFERIRHFWGVMRTAGPEAPQQLSMF